MSRLIDWLCCGLVVLLAFPAHDRVCLVQRNRPRVWDSIGPTKRKNSQPHRDSARRAAVERGGHLAVPAGDDEAGSVCSRVRQSVGSCVRRLRRVVRDRRGGLQFARAGGSDQNESRRVPPDRREDGTGRSDLAITHLQKAASAVSDGGGRARLLLEVQRRRRCRSSSTQCLRRSAASLVFGRTAQCGDRCETK